MRAWLHSGASQGLETAIQQSNSARRPPSHLAKGETLVQVIAASINPIDFKLAELPLGIGKYVLGSPASPAMDYAGRVVSTTRSDLKPGQLVFGLTGKVGPFGTCAEYTVAVEAGCVALPAGVKAVEAATVGTAGLTAYQCITPNVRGLQRARIFINGGSGGTGTFGIQVAKAMGAYVVTSCSTANVELCKKLGADEVLDYKKVDPAKELARAAKDDQSKWFDLVVDNVGSPGDLYKAADNFLKPEGKYVQVGGGLGLSDFATIASRSFLPSILGGGKRQYQFLGGQAEAQC